MERGRRIDLAGRPSLYVSESPGTGLPIVFSNSLAADLSMWNGVRERLSRPSVAYDTRGHGQSAVGTGPCAISDLADDALAVMDAVGLDRAVICGLSLGGATAMAVAETAPQRVAGLVLANTAVTFPPRELWQERAEKARSGNYPALVEPTLDRWLTESFRAAQPDAAEQVRAMIAAIPPDGYAACCEALASADLRSEMRSYGGQVMVIAGAHDTSTPVARAEEIQALSPKAELVVLEAAHLSSVEAAAAFADHLERFAAAVERDHVHV